MPGLYCGSQPFLAHISSFQASPSTASSDGIVVVPGAPYGPLCGLRVLPKLESRQIRPNNAVLVQVLEDMDGFDERLGEVGGIGVVMDPVFLGVCLSLHPQNHPGVEQ